MKVKDLMELTSTVAREQSWWEGATHDGLHASKRRDKLQG